MSSKCYTILSNQTIKDSIVPKYCTMLFAFQIGNAKWIPMVRYLFEIISIREGGDID